MDDQEEIILRLALRVDNLEKREKELEAELKEQEKELQAITTTLKVGKGALIGVVFILGSAGLALGRGIKALWGIE